MRRYLIAIVIALGAHTAATLALTPYRNLLVDAGGLFVHNTDIASIVDRAEAGFLLVGCALVLAAIVVEYLRGRR